MASGETVNYNRKVGCNNDFGSGFTESENYTITFGTTREQRVD